MCSIFGDAISLNLISRYTPPKNISPRRRRPSDGILTPPPRAAGIEEESAHGVRKRLAIRVVEHGATEAQRMAILGHDRTAQAGKYCRTADARKIIRGTDFANSVEPVGKTGK